GDTGVVHDRMDRTEFGLSFLQRAIDLRGQSDVEDYALRLAARSVDLGNVFRKRLGAARRQRNVGAVIGEEAREMLAKAPPAAGDQNVPVFNLKHRNLPRRVAQVMHQDARHFRSASSHAASGCRSGTQARPVLPSEEIASGVTTMSSSAGRLANARSIAGLSCASVSTRSACMPNDLAIPA